MAPEIINGDYDFKCDVWSMGVIMYILLTGTPPFNGKNDNEIIDKVKLGTYSMNKPAFDNVSDKGKDLLQKMLTFDYKKRPSIEECYSHPWFKKENLSEKKNLDNTAMENFKEFYVILFF